MSATLTYNLPAGLLRAKALVLAGLLAALVGLLPVSGAHAQDLGFSRLAPPKSKFHFPDLGDISIWRSHMQKAKRAYRKGNYVKARKHLRKALKKGNFLAAWYLGHIYRLGLGVPVDQAMAFQYYRTVALEYSDNAVQPRLFMITLDSLVRVADGYRTGIKKGAVKAVKKDYGRALRIYKRASLRGHPAAQFGLGRMYLNGQGTRKNVNRGLRWINLSARKRFPPALAMLGELYLKGKYVSKSKIRGLMMYMIAAQVANETIHPGIIDRMEKISSQVSDAVYVKSEQMARHWMERNHPRRNNKFRPLPPRRGKFLEPAGSIPANSPGTN